MEKNNSSLRYLAGACFAGEAILTLVDLVKAGFSIWTLLYPVGYALVAVSMFASLPILTSAGAGICAIRTFRTLSSFFDIIKDYGLVYYVTRPLLNTIFSLLFWVILIVVGVNKKSAKQLSFVAGGVAVLRFAVNMIGFKIVSGTFGLTFRSFLDYSLLIIGTFMIAMAADCITTKVSTSTNVTTSKVVPSTPAGSQVDRLTKLKGLLDNGIISQEEFEAKKKQILGQ